MNYIEPTPEEAVAMQSAAETERLSRDFARETAESILKGYANGEVTFMEFARYVIDTAECAKFTDRQRNEHVGRWLRLGYSTSPAPRKPGRPGLPKWHQEIIAKGIPWAKMQGGIAVLARDISRKSGDAVSAYEILAHRLTSFGLSTTADQAKRYSGKRERPLMSSKSVKRKKSAP